jgi:hypothetical protein
MWRCHLRNASCSRSGGCTGPERDVRRCCGGGRPGGGRPGGGRLDGGRLDGGGVQVTPGGGWPWPRSAVTARGGRPARWRARLAAGASCGRPGRRRIRTSPSRLTLSSLPVTWAWYSSSAGRSMRRGHPGVGTSAITARHAGSSGPGGWLRGPVARQPCRLASGENAALPGHAIAGEGGVAARARGCGFRGPRARRHAPAGRGLRASPPRPAVRESRVMTVMVQRSPRRRAWPAAEPPARRAVPIYPERPMERRAPGPGVTRTPW